MPWLFRSSLMVGVLTAASLASAQQPADPLMGTRTVNLAKSTFNPGPPPKSITLIYEAAGRGLKAVANSVLADGSTRTLQYAANFDGKDYPVTGRVVDRRALVSAGWDTVPRAP